MGGKYEILARNYTDEYWRVGENTNNIIKALAVWIMALVKYELIEFNVRK